MFELFKEFEQVTVCYIYNEKQKVQINEKKTISLLLIIFLESWIFQSFYCYQKKTFCKCKTLLSFLSFFLLPLLNISLHPSIYLPDFVSFFVFFNHFSATPPLLIQLFLVSSLSIHSSSFQCLFYVKCIYLSFSSLP